jgi:microcystin-dependent protein
MSKSIQFQKDGENLYPCPFYPVGSIYLSITTTNPSTYFGGTWSQIAQGRTLVGVNTSDSDFNTVKKTGGSKTVTLTVNQMPSHSHVQYVTANSGAGQGTRADYAGEQGNYGQYSQGVNTASAGGDQAHNNLQPYYTCYIWLRTA